MKIKICSLLLIMAFISGCNFFEKFEENESEDGKRMGRILIAAAAINANRGGGVAGRETYAGIAEIPSSMTNSSSTFVEEFTNVSSTYKFASTKYSVPKVYDRVRAYAKAIQVNTKQIGDLISVLESMQVTGTNANPQTGSGLTWLNQGNSKYRFQPSSVLQGGKKMEVWWNDAATAPYTSLKAIELNYVGSTSSGKISGFAFLRIPFVPPTTEVAVTNDTLNTAGMVNTSAPPAATITTLNALTAAYINFSYDSATKTRTTVVIFDGIPNLAGSALSDNAHFYIQEVDGVTTMDGTYTVSDFSANTVATTMANINNAAGATVSDAGLNTDVTPAGRAYTFSAVGDSKRAIYRVALPLVYTPATGTKVTEVTTTGIYSNTSVGTSVPAFTTTVSGYKFTYYPGLASIGQVWTNFLLTNSTTIGSLNNDVGGVCGSNYIMTPPVPPTTVTIDSVSYTTVAGNPLSFTGVTTTSTLKTCLDEILGSGGQSSTASLIQDLYFLTNIKNPAYFKVSGTSSGLYGVESLNSSDGDSASYSKLETNLNFLNSVRTTAYPSYSANFDPYSVSQINLFAANVAGITAVPQGISATSLTNLNAMWGDGTTTGSNFINGSTNDTAPTTIP